MTDLAEFLLSRIAEDEEIARRSTDLGDLEAAGWYPDRILAECEAKRRIIELHAPVEDWIVTNYQTGAGGPCQRCGHCVIDTDEYREEWELEIWPCPTLRLLALPYADHLGYLPEWRP